MCVGAILVIARRARKKERAGGHKVRPFESKNRSFQMTQPTSVYSG
jgi:hypothetical protein